MGAHASESWRLAATASFDVAACSGGRASSVPTRCRIGRRVRARRRSAAGQSRRRQRGRARRQVRLQLQWAPQAQFAGYFAAAGAGLLRGRGPRRHDRSTAARTSSRRPSARPPTAPSSRSPGCPKVLQAREGTPASDLVNIAQIFQRSGTLSVSWKDSNITEPGRLQGQEGRRLGLRQRVRGHGRRPRRPGSTAGHRLHEGHPDVRHDACCSRSRSTSPRR